MFRQVLDVGVNEAIVIFVGQLLIVVGIFERLVIVVLPVQLEFVDRN